MVVGSSQVWLLPAPSAVMLNTSVFSKVVPLLRRIEIIFCPIYFLRVKYFNNFCFIYFFLICSKAFMIFLQVSSNFVIFTEVFLHY